MAQTSKEVTEDSSVESGDDEYATEVGDESATGSSSSDENDEKENCPICLHKFRGQELGTPETCDHTFCFHCISEWSTNTNTCPIDRKNFRFIFVRSEVNGRVIRKLPVKEKDYDSDAIEGDDDERTFCEVCGQANFEDRLLLCDSCDKGYHLECLTPPLDEVPVDEWFCPGCTVQERNRRPAAVRRRAIPRTRAAERVRNRIANRLDFFVDYSSDTSLSAESEYDENNDNDVDDDDDVLYELNADEKMPSTSSSSVKPKPPKRRRFRRRRRRRRTVKRVGASSSSTSRSKGLSKKTKKPTSGRRRRRRRRVKRRKPRALRRTLSESNLFDFLNRPTEKSQSGQQGSVKSRLADQLGIIPPKKAFQQPTVKLKAHGEPVASSTLTSNRQFSLFGNRNELLHFDGDESYEDDGIQNGLSEKARRFNRRLIGRISKECARQKSEAGENSNVTKENLNKIEQSADILGSIFENQSLLLRNSEDVIVNRDGSLEARKPTVDNVKPPPHLLSPTDSTKSSGTKIGDACKLNGDPKLSSSCSSLTSTIRSPEERKPVDSEISDSVKQSILKPSAETAAAVDSSCRKSFLDTRIEALAVSKKVAPQQLPDTVAVELGIKDSSQKRKGPLLPSPINVKKSNVINTIPADLVVPPPPPPLPFVATSTGSTALSRTYHHQSINSRPISKSRTDILSEVNVPPALCNAPASVLNFAGGSLLPNVHVPPPPTPVSLPTYATPTFLSAAARGAVLPVRLPFPFGSELNAAQLNDALNTSAFQQLAGLRFALPPNTALRLPMTHGSAFVQLPPYQQVPFQFLAQQTHQSLSSLQTRPTGVLLNPLAVHDFPPPMPFGVHQSVAPTDSLHRPPDSFAIDPQAVTGSNLIMREQIVSKLEPPHPAVPENKSPSSIPLPPEEPVVRSSSSSTSKFDLKDSDIPSELLGLLTQFAQMKNEQSLRDASKKSHKSVDPEFSSTPFEPSPVKRPLESSVAPSSAVSPSKKAPPPIIRSSASAVDDDDSPFSPALSLYDGDFSPDFAQPAVLPPPSAVSTKPVRSVQFHPEVEDTKTKERLSKSEKLQKRTEEKLKNLLSRVASASSNNGSSGNDDEVPSSAVDLRRRERLLAKFNYQLRVEEEVKIALKPYYSKRRLTKEQYKNIMRKTVPKICKKKAEINPAKIHAFVESYIQKTVGPANVTPKIKSNKQRKSEED